jgi:amino acid transporter
MGRFRDKMFELFKILQPLFIVVLFFLGLSHFSNSLLSGIVYVLVSLLIGVFFYGVKKQKKYEKTKIKDKKLVVRKVLNLGMVISLIIAIIVIISLIEIFKPLLN